MVQAFGVTTVSCRLSLGFSLAEKRTPAGVLLLGCGVIIAALTLWNFEGSMSSGARLVSLLISGVLLLAGFLLAGVE
jgi:hypothetical protein